MIDDSNIVCILNIFIINCTLLTVTIIIVIDVNSKIVIVTIANVIYVNMCAIIISQFIHPLFWVRNITTAFYPLAHKNLVQARA